MHPLRISIVSYNIWSDHRWDFRKNALRKFLEVFEPDVLCLQELNAGSRNLIDATLPGHARVEDAFEGWTSESNICWRANLFSEIEHGAEEVGIALGARRLFWSRLNVADSDRSILVATAHLTHQRHEAEQASGISPRVDQTRRMVEALQRLNRDGEAAFVMGDFNDPVHPTTILHKAGYSSCFARLGLQPPHTFKSYPTANVAFGEPVMTQCVDWLVANARARVLSAAVPQFFFEDAAPSDHWPVHAVYEIR